MTSSPAPVMWRLGRSLPEHEVRTVPENRGWLIEGLGTRERHLGLLPGHPFLLRPDGSADADVLAFFASSSFKLLSEQTRLSYAKDLRLFLSFLESKSWRDCTPADLLDFEHWRRRDAANPRRVSGAKLGRELAACKKFFDWQRQRGTLGTDPARMGHVERSGSPLPGAALRPRDARSSRVKWLTPRAFRQWRDVGLGGYRLDGSRDRSWRGRSDGRNVAFANLLWSSGLRLREAGTLLRSELPSPELGARYLRARMGQAVAKGRGRDFWMSSEALLDLEGYVISTRAAAVARAQREGRYESVAQRLVVVGSERSGLQVRDGEGETRTVSLDLLSARDRARLFIEGPNGVEPAMLFLGESGLPMRFESWEAVFAGASRRCTRLGVPVSCYPHMLRHSFALRMLVTLLHAFDRRMGLTPEERRDYRLLYGDPWTLVQTLLGHTNPQTTRDIYLEPVSGLQVDLFLNTDGDGGDEPFTDFVQRHLTATGLVNPGRED